jgi:WD40-like Beta Propeller Repeat
MRRLIVVLTALLTLPGTAQAAFPGANGKIAATAFDSFSNGIHTLNPDGTGDTWLTPDDSTTSAPAWSPDGTKIAFDRLGTNRDVWVMNADGTNRMPLTNDPAYDGNPAWSPDGTRIVFESTRDGNRELYVMNADGSNPVRITNDPATDRDPSWSPDGTKIAFSSDREHFVCDSYPYCQPRATYRIFTINVDGSDVTRITVTRLGDSGHSAADHYHPDWSPSGAQLVYQSAEDDYSEEFYADRIITTGPGGRELSLIYGGTYPDSGVAWSPDGQYIVSTYDYETHVIAANSGGYGNTISLCCNQYPSWQPIPINGYPRPKGATPMYIPLVPAYAPCGSPNREHGSPLVTGSCNPPVQSSGSLTVGTLDANDNPAKSVGFADIRVKLGNPATPADEADVRLELQITDVRNTDLSDYTGELQARPLLRITDKDNTPNPGGPGAATTQDTPFPFTVPCGSTADGTIGSICSVLTTADGVLPGSVKEERRSNWQLQRFDLYDGGPDGDAETSGDNTLFATEGIFVP